VSNHPPHDPNVNKSDEPDEIIEDLMSIKDLLNESEDFDGDQQVPLLDDPLEQTVTIDEGMPDDTFKALLDDAWQDSVEDLFNDARSRIERNREAWLPEDTDDLAAALKVRIDASVRAWLQETLEANIGRLRERIVSELSTELLAQMREKFSQPPTPPLTRKD
jgi:hypothetical protein